MGKNVRNWPIRICHQSPKLLNLCFCATCSLRWRWCQLIFLHYSSPTSSSLYLRNMTSFSFACPLCHVIDDNNSIIPVPPEMTPLLSLFRRRPLGRTTSVNALRLYIIPTVAITYPQSYFLLYRQSLRFEVKLCGFQMQENILFLIFSGEKFDVIAFLLCATTHFFKCFPTRIYIPYSQRDSINSKHCQILTKNASLDHTIFYIILARSFSIFYFFLGMFIGG